MPKAAMTNCFAYVFVKETAFLSTKYFVPRSDGLPCQFSLGLAEKESSDPSGCRIRKSTFLICSTFPCPFTSAFQHFSTFLMSVRGTKGLKMLGRRRELPIKQSFCLSLSLLAAYTQLHIHIRSNKQTHTHIFPNSKPIIQD